MWLIAWPIAKVGLEQTVTQDITLDGVIDAAEGWFSPSGEGEEIDQSDIIEAVREESEGRCRV